MDTVKSFFTTQTKESFANAQHQGGNYEGYGGRSSTYSGYNNGNNGSQSPDIGRSNAMDAKRKDSDSYFYIMWRS